MTQTFDIYEVQLDILMKAFNGGLRLKTLGNQPAPWMVKGLQVLESGHILTIEILKNNSLSGGTDHPDPFI